MWNRSSLIIVAEDLRGWKHRWVFPPAMTKAQHTRYTPMWYYRSIQKRQFPYQRNSFVTFPSGLPTSPFDFEQADIGRTANPLARQHPRKEHNKNPSEAHSHAANSLSTGTSSWTQKILNEINSWTSEEEVLSKQAPATLEVGSYIPRQFSKAGAPASALRARAIPWSSEIFSDMTWTSDALECWEWEFSSLDFL